MGIWNKIKSSLVPASNKIEFDTESLGKFALKVTEGHLPSGFQEVDWISNEGYSNAYIDSGVDLTNATAKVSKHTVTAQLLSTSGWRMYGIHSVWSFSVNSNGYYVYYAGNSENTTSYTPSYNKITYCIDYNAGTFISDLFSITMPNWSDRSFTARWKIMRGNTTASEDFTFQTKIYEEKLEINNEVIRDFIPCYCTETVTAYQGTTQTTAASGTAGMYDLVENKFYINSGTGSFTVGPDVN